MKTLKLTIAIAALLPTLAFATAGPTPPQPGDLPPNVNTGGSWYVEGGVTIYRDARNDLEVNCDEEPAKCAGLAEAQLNPPEDDPEGDPEGEPETPPEGEGGKGGGILGKIFKKNKD